MGQYLHLGEELLQFSHNLFAFPVPGLRVKVILPIRTMIKTVMGLDVEGVKLLSPFQDAAVQGFTNTQLPGHWHEVFPLVEDQFR